MDQADSSADEDQVPRRGDGYRLKGLASFHRKRYSDAIGYWQTSLKSAPTFEGYHFLGLNFYNQGELESALSQYRKILDRIPDSRQARLMTAQILLKQKRYDDSANEIKKVLQKDDDDALAHDLLGSVYMLQGSSTMACAS